MDSKGLGEPGLGTSVGSTSAGPGVAPSRRASVVPAALTTSQPRASVARLDLGNVHSRRNTLESLGSLLGGSPDASPTMQSSDLRSIISLKEQELHQVNEIRAIQLEEQMKVRHGARDFVKARDSDTKESQTDSYRE